MTLGSMSAKPRPGSREEEILRALRSGGYAIRYVEEDGVHRIAEPTQHGNTTVGLIVIREQRIHYAEFDRTVLPWWGRGRDTATYESSLSRLEELVREGRRK